MKKLLIVISVCLFFIINSKANCPVGAPEYYTEIKRDSNYVYSIVDVDKKPVFSGEMDSLVRFINRNLRWPNSDACVQGKVYCNFIIEKDGSISNVKIIKSTLPPDFEKEAIRVISIMPKWIPAEKNGKIVRCNYTIPINFKLQ